MICLMSSDVVDIYIYIRDKLRPMPKHGSKNKKKQKLYVHGSQKTR